MKKFLKKLPKWAKIVLWIVGILVGLILIAIIALKIWVSTWPKYEGDGFSLRYPQGWNTQKIDKVSGLPDNVNGLLILSNVAIPNRNPSQLLSPVGDLFLYFVRTSKSLPGSDSVSKLQQNLTAELRRTGISPLVIEKSSHGEASAYVAYLSNNSFIVHYWLDNPKFIYEASLVGTDGVNFRGMYFDLLGKLILKSFRTQ